MVGCWAEPLATPMAFLRAEMKVGMRVAQKGASMAVK